MLSGCVRREPAVYGWSRRIRGEAIIPGQVKVQVRAQLDSVMTWRSGTCRAGTWCCTTAAACADQNERDDQSLAAAASGRVTAERGV